ncbi:hypothetical protein SAMN05444487_110120 [Marininema mesophilum]|uniref:DUF309 domain-containing protein n=1 Tax=Marininema mesophilum TaxID=1048340 RepID=A0A1H2Z6J3_9BACL|nr:DUF309 domain-containing protein [Marininema mesophilum]SDX12494.1 hypothetical protein SAMN05444487_110120 [Marininema mesophilum]
MKKSENENKGYSPLYVQFLYHFNYDRDYFECHEVLEELWLEEGRDPLYQGLLQVAVALYHHRNENENGARKLFRGALEKITHYPGDALGIDLEKLKHEAAVYLEKLEGSSSTTPYPFRDLNIVIKDSYLQSLVEEMERKLEEKQMEDGEIK